ncbi:MAG: transposase [Phycisphaerae bacterium]|nr:transposase [Phycisphaerae bacterium]
MRDELLNRELFADLSGAKALAASWQNEYNHRRPHSSLGYLTPAVYAQQCRRMSADESGGSASKPPASKPPPESTGKAEARSGSPRPIQARIHGAGVPPT